MKTPRSKQATPRIVVEPPPAGAPVVSPADPPTAAEARRIARSIRPHFGHYATQYDTKKYWPEVYDRVRIGFAKPADVAPVTLRDALMWKYGYLGKAKIPQAQERLIVELQGGWQTTARRLPGSPREDFEILDRALGGKTRFVTMAFLLHLLHSDTIPIIDQHNFRAVNGLMASARPGWTRRGPPARYEDLELVAQFMDGVVKAWQTEDPAGAQSPRELDKFLMMYGKALKNGT